MIRNERLEVADSSVIAGAAIYSAALLAVYDLYVLGLSNSFAWKCETRKLLDLYDRNVTDNHIDIGIGTGFYLDRCKFPSNNPRITLGDLNDNCLEKVGRRIARYSPTAVRLNVFDPRTYPAGTFDSMGVNYLLHCLPGPCNKKLEIFETLKNLLNTGGVLFGSTILGDEMPHNAFGRFLMKTYNRKGIFSNSGDTAAELEAALTRAFGNCRIEIEGCVAIFSARK